MDTCLRRKRNECVLYWSWLSPRVSRAQIARSFDFLTPLSTAALYSPSPKHRSTMPCTLCGCAELQIITSSHSIVSGAKRYWRNAGRKGRGCDARRRGPLSR